MSCFYKQALLGRRTELDESADNMNVWYFAISRTSAAILFVTPIAENEKKSHNSPVSFSD